MTGIFLNMTELVKNGTEFVLCMTGFVNLNARSSAQISSALIFISTSSICIFVGHYFHWHVGILNMAQFPIDESRWYLAHRAIKSIN